MKFRILSSAVHCCGVVVLSPLAAAQDVSTSGVSTPLIQTDFPALDLGGFNMVTAGGSTWSQPAAEAAFNRAMQSWMRLISDPITVTIEVKFDPLGAGIIGSTLSEVLQDSFANIRNAMVADASNESDDAIVAHLPTVLDASNTFVPAGCNLTGYMIATKANFKALGYADIDSRFGVNDATITFSTSFPFDFDNSDGVGEGLVDFETVAAHEIGHVLGFSSVVDQVNGGVTSIYPRPLDLFRFRAGSDPTTATDFETFKRDLVPGSAGGDAIFDDLGFEYKMSEGLNPSTFPGTDGNQASHWKADELAGLFIGLMDPTLAYQQSYGPGQADFRALDVIGYEIDFTPVPEMSSLGGGLLLLLGMARRRR